MTSYEALPFQESDIQELYPVPKYLDIQNNDVRNLIQQAKLQFKLSDTSQIAESLYTEAIEKLGQINGPMCKEMAGCYSKLASIKFKYGSYLEAIGLQTKSIILQERILGIDHPQTAYSYSNLALYYHTV